MIDEPVDAMGDAVDQWFRQFGVMNEFSERAHVQSEMLWHLGIREADFHLAEALVSNRSGSYQNKWHAIVVALISWESQFRMARTATPHQVTNFDAFSDVDDGDPDHSG